MSNFIDLEILHTLPFSNANRDDAGQPKTVVVGGATRGRLSSQSLKRAARFYNADKVDGFAGESGGSNYVRTKRVKDLLDSKLEELGADEEVLKKVESLFGKTSPFGQLVSGKGSDKTLRQDTLVVVTQEEIAALAQRLIDGMEVKPQDIVDILVNSGKRDLALWGRFFASADKATLDGAAQVGHAFTTHAVNIEPDFFVGLDDAAPLFSEHAGAGHPGDSFYLTGTFYKYANFNVEETVLNLLNAKIHKDGYFITEDPDADALVAQVQEITREFITSFALSVPQGKIRSTAHQTLPSLVRVSHRAGRPVSGATAFDAPVKTWGNQDTTVESAKVLAATHQDLEAFVGRPVASHYLAVEKVKPVVESLGTAASSLDGLINEINNSIPAVVHATLTKVEVRLSN